MKEIIKTLVDGRLLLEINKTIYDIKAITQTSYKFTDKCYIHIDPISEHIIGVYFKNKPENTDFNWNAFGNCIPHTIPPRIGFGRYDFCCFFRQH